MKLVQFKYHFMAVFLEEGFKNHYFPDQVYPITDTDAADLEHKGIVKDPDQVKIIHLPWRERMNADERNQVLAMQNRMAAQSTFTKEIS